MKLAIVCVAYNRPDCLSRLLASLEQASYPETTTLIISIDKSETDAVEKMADDYHWPHGESCIVKHEKNLGLRAHMLSIGNYFNKFDALIVLEDDVTVSSSFYYYAKASVEKYYGNDSIAGISLYSFSTNYQNCLPFTPAKSSYDAYFMNCAQSWGEVWMKPQWEAFIKWYESHSENFHLGHLPQCLNEWPKSSWLKYHTRYCIEMDKYFVYPYYSMTTNNADPGINFQGNADTLFQANMQVFLQKDFHLPETNSEEASFYDGFFQPKNLGKYLNIPEEELCVDLFAEKPSCLHRHFLLTDRLMPYKVVKSFALQLRPIEMNIISHREGKEIWLYDTSFAAPHPEAPDKYLAYTYFYKKGLVKTRKMVGLKRIVTLAIRIMKAKMAK